MDLAGHALSLVSKLLEKVEDVKANEQDCKLLVEYAERTAPLLEHLSIYSASDVGVNEGLKALVEALEMANKVVNDCCRCTTFVAMYHSVSIADDLKKATSSLSNALSLLSAANIGVAAETHEELLNLKKEMKEARFGQSAASRQQTLELKRLLEIGFNTNVNSNAEVMQMIREMVQTHSKTNEELQQDLALFKGCLSDARKNKERLEEYELEQIINAIESGMQTEDLTTKQDTLNADLRSQLQCPISAEFMTDPVLVKESGMTYQRSSIKEWFERGHRTDPQTNVRLVSMELIPNTAVKRLVELVTGQEGHAASEDKQEKHQKSERKLKPGIWEGQGIAIFPPKESKTVHITLILEPNTSLIGYYLILAPKGNPSKTELIFSGEWSQEPPVLVFSTEAEQCPVVYVRGHFAFQSSAPYPAAQVFVSSTIPAAKIDTKSYEVSSVNVKISQFEFFHFAQPHARQYYNLGPGFLQMDGVVTGTDGRQYPNRLVLLLDEKDRLQGWSYGLDEEKTAPSVYGEVDGGDWKADTGVLSFRLRLVLECAGDVGASAQSNSPWLQFTGKISHSKEFTEPLFRGGCQSVGVDAVYVDQIAESGFGFALTSYSPFEYTHFACPSVPICPTQTNKLTPLTRWHPPNISSCFAGTGICYIMMEKNVDGRNSETEGCYLTQSDIGRDEEMDMTNVWLGWQSDLHLATQWKIERADDESGITIASRTANTSYIAQHIYFPGDHRNQESYYPHCRAFNTEKSSVFRMRCYKGCIVAVLHASRCSTGIPAVGYALSAPNPSLSRDQLAEGMTSAVMHKDWDQAAGLSFLYVSMDSAIIE